jgi:hypothetical protein
MHTPRRSNKNEIGYKACSRPGGSRRSSAWDRNLHSMVQGLPDRSHTNIQAHTGNTLLQAGGHIWALGVVGKGSLAASIRH